MKILVSGGRNYDHWQLIHATLDRIHQAFGITKVIHGGAKGAAWHAGNWASLKRLHITERKADWDRYGNVAGRLRNEEMLIEDKPDLVVIFPGGRGTEHMKGLVETSGQPCLVVTDPTWRPFDEIGDGLKDLIVDVEDADRQSIAVSWLNEPDRAFINTHAKRKAAAPLPQRYEPMF